MERNLPISARSLSEQSPATQALVSRIAGAGNSQTVCATRLDREIDLLLEKSESTPDVNEITAV